MSPALAGGFFTTATPWEALDLYYLILVTLGLPCCTRAFPNHGKWRLLFTGVPRLPTVAASLPSELRRLSCSAACAAFPDQGRPVCPAFAGRALSTVLPGKSFPSNLTLQRRGLGAELQLTTGSPKAFVTVHRLSRDKSDKYFMCLAGRAPMMSKNENTGRVINKSNFR